MNSTDPLRRDRVRRLGEIVAENVPTSILDGPEATFEHFSKALGYSTVGEAVQDVAASVEQS